MPTVEIDELELHRLQKSHNYLKNIWDRPEARTHLLRGHKLVDPNDPAVQDLDKPDPRDEQLKALEKRFDDDKKAREDAESERTKNEQITRFQTAWDNEISELRRNGWQEEGIKQLEKIRAEKGIMSARDCATLFERDHPPAAPISNIGNSWNFTDPMVVSADEDLKKLIESKGDNEAITNKMVHDALQDVRQANPLLGRR